MCTLGKELAIERGANARLLERIGAAELQIDLLVCELSSIGGEVNEELLEGARARLWAAGLIAGC